MIFWGKIIGAFLGFSMGGPIGCLLGIYIGHKFDTGLAQNFGHTNGFSTGNQHKIQTVFFSATFSVMGHMAKADGVVTPNEIQLANKIMDEMQLNPTLRQNARELFSQGKSKQFDLNETLNGLNAVAGGHKALLLMFVEIQIRAATADGKMDMAEKKVLLQIANLLKVSQFELDSLISRHQAQQRYSGYQSGHQSTTGMIANAYAVLGVKESSSEAEVKKAYRKLMSQHHPDKLVAKGLPEQMLVLAKEKTQEIQAAYDLIKGQKK